MNNAKPTVPPRTPASGLVWAAGILSVLVLLAVGVVAAQESAPEIDSGQVSIGRSLFRGYCGSCHGPEARGDGPIAEYLRVAPADLTRLSKKNGGEFPFDAVVKKIDGRDSSVAHGSDMPVWGDAFQKAEGGGGDDAVTKKVNALAHYLRSIQVSEEAGR